jgi:hypothetical protein
MPGSNTLDPVNRPQRGGEIRTVLFDKDGTLFSYHETWGPILREAAAMAPPVPAATGTWDGRFRLAGRQDMDGACSLGALGVDAARFRDASDLPAEVLRTVPALRRAGEVVAVPLIAWAAAGYEAAATLFAPPRPAAAAPFLHATSFAWSFARTADPGWGCINPQERLCYVASEDG